MKQFFKFLFASLLGTLVAIFIICGIFAAIIGIIASSAKKDKDISVKENSVLYMNFEENISDRSSDDPFENFDFDSFKSTPQLGMNDILDNLKKAGKDERIKGVFLDLTILDIGMARINEIRNALRDFKTSGKFVYAYSDALDQNAYYLATVADKIFLHPGGIMLFNGLAAQPIFFKGTFDKLEIDMQVIRHGKFKSAVELFTRKDMSEENRIQTSAFVGSLWETMLENISTSRSIEVDQLQQMANTLSIGSPEEAVSNGIIDAIAYRDEVLSELKSLSGTDSSKEVSFVKIRKYSHAIVENGDKKSAEDYKNKIAVVYAEGEIRYGESQKDIMGSKTISEAIEKARKNEHVKAVVMRVNSPGGSSLASDIIWREIALTKKVKPVVVSMGNLAASGGYYISCSATKIIADKNTITGSIGVFGIIPNTRQFFDHKLGITFDTVNTNTYADLGSVVRPLKPRETKFITDLVERIYDDFVSKVAEGRSMSYAEVDSIGQGRVWSGRDALTIGLVDEIGGLHRAIEAAAELADLEDYTVYELPEQKGTLQLIVSQFREDLETDMTKRYFGRYFDEFNQVYRAMREFGIYARMPIDYYIH